MIPKDVTQEFNKEYYPTEEDILSEGWELFIPSQEEILVLARVYRTFNLTLLRGDVSKARNLFRDIVLNSDAYMSEEERQKEVKSAVARTDEEITMHIDATKKNNRLNNIEKLEDSHFMYEKEQVVYFKKGDYVRLIITNLSIPEDKTWIKFAFGTRETPVVIFTSESVLK